MTDTIPLTLNLRLSTYQALLPHCDKLNVQAHVLVEKLIERALFSKPTVGGKQPPLIAVTPDQLEVIRQLASDGKTDEEIAELLPFDEARIRDERRSAGIKRSKKKQLAPDVLARLRQLAESRHIDTDIAAELGLPLSRVKTERNALGIPASRQRPLTEEQLAEIRRLAEARTMDADIAAALDLPVNRVATERKGMGLRRARAASVAARPRTPRVPIVTLPDEVAQQVLELVSEGLVDQRVADRLGIDKADVQAVRRANGIVKKPGRPSLVDDDKRALILRLHQEEHDVDVIAERTGLRPSRVTKELAELRKAGRA